VFSVVRRSFCRSIMLRQEKLGFIKASFTLRLSPAILKEVRMALPRKKKNPAVPARSRSTAPGEGTEPPTIIKTCCGQAQTNELASSGDSSVP
jgi:hypothetical protein